MDPISSNILIFTILSMVILLAPLLASRLRIPDIVLLMLAGALLGEHGLGLLRRSSAITLFGEVGLVYIMFLSGLEIDLFEFARTRRKSILFGFITFLVPQAIGTFAAMTFLGLAWGPALLIASMFASHTLLTYPAASRLGIHKTEPVTITVGGTIVTNVLSLLVLAVVLESHRGNTMDAGFWLGIGGGLLALGMLTWWGIPRLARWFFQNVTESGGSQFMFVLGITCGCAYLSYFARMEPIIGAFLAGAAFNRLIPEQSPLMNRLEFSGNTLFIPFFLISVGMLVDPSALVSDLQTWRYIGVMTGSVVGTKFIAAWMGGKLFRYRREEWMVMFGLSVVQAAATLAAALIGLQAGILNAASLNGAIGMILVSVVLGAWAVEKYGRIIARRALAATGVPSNEQRILLSVYNPESAARLMDLGLLLRDNQRPGTLYPLTIVREQTQSDEAVARGEQLLASCLRQVASTGANVVPSVRVDLNPADGITRAVRDLRASLVLTGWGGELTASARIFGTVSLKLTEQCPSRLFLCRILTPPHTNSRLLLPFPPLSEHRGDLAELIGDAKRLCKQLGVDLWVYVSGEAAGLLRARVENATPGCNTRFVQTDAWSQARARMFDDIHANSMILLPQERRNSVLWTPTLDRLPELIAARFPQANFLVAYPPLPETEGEGVLAFASPEGVAMPEIHGVELTPGMEGEAAILHLVRMGLGEDEGMGGDACAQLLISARHHPVEVAPEVLLIHAHCGTRTQPLLLVGHGRPRHPFFETKSPPKTLLALISPRGHAPENHLRTLASIAERMRDPVVLEHVAAADDTAALCRALSQE